MQLIQFRSDIDIECPICFDHMKHGDSVTVLPCHHYFCHRCITEWNSVNNACPICRNSNDSIPSTTNNDDIAMLMINDHNRYVQSVQADPAVHLNLNFESCHGDYIKVVIKDIPNDITFIYPWSSIGNSRQISFNIYNLLNLSCISIYIKLDRYYYKFHLEHNINDIRRSGNILFIDIDGAVDLVARSTVAGQRLVIVDYGFRYRRYCPNCLEDTGVWLSDYWSDDCDEIFIYDCGDCDQCTIL
jgi:hypothetical protein